MENAPTRDQKKFIIFRFIRTFTLFVGNLSSFLILAIMFLITADVLSRYIFGIPVKGSYELSEMMFLSVVFLGLGYTQLYNGHVRVEFLVIRFHQRTQKILNTIMLLFALSIYTLLVWKGAEGFLESYESGEYRWGLIQIPLWPVKLMIPLGSSLLCLRFVDEIVSNVINICRRN